MTSCVDGCLKPSSFKCIPQYTFVIFALTALLTPIKVIAQQERAQPVSIAVIKPEKFSGSFEALGTLRSYESISISPNITEIIDVIYFDDNATIQKDDLIVELRSREVRAELAEAEARVGEAERQYQRVKSLGRDGAEPPAIVDERLRNYETAVAQKNAIEARLADHLIRAPFSGQLGIRTLSPGALVQPGDVINTLDDLSRMKLDFEVPASLISSLKPELKLVAETSAYPGETFSAVVKSINTRVDPVTRSITVRAELDNQSGKLRPGLLMKVIVYSPEREALLAPEESIVTRGGSRFVYKVSKNGEELRAELTQVQTGERGAGMVEILSGISSNDEIVTHGTVRLRGGELLRIVDQ